jgi:hypothetical protein
MRDLIACLTAIEDLAPGVQCIVWEAPDYTIGLQGSLKAFPGDIAYQWSFPAQPVSELQAYLTRVVLGRRNQFMEKQK